MTLRDTQNIGADGAEETIFQVTWEGRKGVGVMSSSHPFVDVCRGLAVGAVRRAMRSAQGGRMRCSMWFMVWVVHATLWAVRSVVFQGSVSAWVPHGTHRVKRGRAVLENDVSTHNKLRIGTKGAVPHTTACALTSGTTHQTPAPGNQKRQK